ncbi:MAG: hypothetical protein II023_07460, partial [Prevotella sp.]|nr:hypothetical protein [Prevotella sp.]
MNPLLLLTLINPTDKFPAEYYYYYRYYSLVAYYHSLLEETYFSEEYYQGNYFLSHHFCYLLYFLSLESCYLGEGVCSTKLKWIKRKVIEEIISCVLLAIILELIFFNVISK